jgi:threonine dehydrogenase-like Zn-dependent dehydrogenase
LMRSGKVDLRPLLTHVYPLEAVSDALAALESRQAVRPIVEM